MSGSTRAQQLFNTLGGGSDAAAMGLQRFVAKKLEHDPAAILGGALASTIKKNDVHKGVAKKASADADGIPKMAKQAMWNVVAEATGPKASPKGPTTAIMNFIGENNSTGWRHLDDARARTKAGHAWAAEPEKKARGDAFTAAPKVADIMHRWWETCSTVIVGHLLEPENDEFGAGPHHIYTEWECVMLADELITHHITNEPKIVLLPTINAGEEDYVMLDEQTHDGIMKTIEGHV